MSVADRRFVSVRAHLAFGATVAVYLALILPTVARHGISWDEQTDLDIASHYVTQPGGWLEGSDADPMNARLPMAAGAALFALIGERSLVAARLLSCAAGGLTLLAVFRFCRRELDARKGVLACLVLATSPYFLAYSRVAFTEGDAFVTSALAWLLVCLAGLRGQRCVGWGALTGIALGVALASKVSAAAAAPVVLITLLLPARDEAEPAGAGTEPRGWKPLVAALGALYLAVVGGWYVGRIAGGGTYDHAGRAFLAGHAAVVVALWLTVLGLSASRRHLEVGNWRLAGFVLVLAGLTFFAVPPVHTTNPDVVLAMADAFFFSNFEAPASFALEAAVLHGSVIAVKSSPVIGIAAWSSVVVAAIRVRARPELRLPLLMLACYVLFLIRLPWAQTFYMMPALPVIAILLADMGVELFDRRRAVALAFAAVAAAGLVTDLWRSHPDFHLNGYQWVGARPWGGRPTLGPRSLVQLPADGVEQAMRFVDDHARPGETVVLYVRPLHIVAATVRHPRYQLVDGLRDRDALDSADYVVTTLASEVRAGFGPKDPQQVFDPPYDPDRLHASFTRVFAVTRAFDLEVAAVWKRRPH